MKEHILPLKWWTFKRNFGDLLSPWLARKLYNGEVEYCDGKKEKTYIAIGSVIDKATPFSIVWGSGAFGTENLPNVKNKSSLCLSATYTAVRGPLTRNLLRIHGADVPAIYGDPALLVPYFYKPKDVIHKYQPNMGGGGRCYFDVGIVLRWSESNWNKLNYGDGIKKIYLGSGNIESTINDILSCKRIMSSSLHGIILADAYKIPSAWIDTQSANGYNFKFYDYMISVRKVQEPQYFNERIYGKTGVVNLQDILENFYFDDRIIKWDPIKLIDACPFIDNNVKINLIKKIAIKCIDSQT